MLRFYILDDDGFTVGTISAKSKADAIAAANGRQIKQVKPAKQQTPADRFRSAMAEAGPARF